MVLSSDTVINGLPDSVKITSLTIPVCPKGFITKTGSLCEKHKLKASRKKRTDICFIFLKIYRPFFAQTKTLRKKGSLDKMFVLMPILQYIGNYCLNETKKLKKPWYIK